MDHRYSGGIQDCILYRHWGTSHQCSPVALFVANECFTQCLVLKRHWFYVTLINPSGFCGLSTELTRSSEYDDIFYVVPDLSKTLTAAVSACVFRGMELFSPVVAADGARYLGSSSGTSERSTLCPTEDLQIINSMFNSSATRTILDCPPRVPGRRRPRDRRRLRRPPLAREERHRHSDEQHGTSIHFL